ncbi:hypothetical protein PS647_02468 [Pseudomonas fluorescens]|uniref:DUF3616 domain-containing protein n=1 Tax=Pseudomonas fluorescens TaxID=294 RepID=UPI00123F97CE|nr:DUF3616 domain-containing protein [Pseudomonas fluorescens]VVM83971.1 hypothetical protein PS647_02468 [Pseudomonas fluorescens]
MNRINRVFLKFDSQFDMGEKKKLRDGLSAVLQIDQTLWLANDETLSLERLTFHGQTATDDFMYGEHQQFPLSQLLNLPVPPKSAQNFEEADIEGLAFDETESYLWLIGSHSLKRKQADPEKSEGENIARLSKVGSDGNRYLLARIPVVEQDGSLQLTRESVEPQRTAAQLHGEHSWSALTKALKHDEHLGDFFATPSKDNGFDIEGLAVAGKRLFIGLRGPVLRGWAIILEIEPQVDEHDSHTLTLAKIGEDCCPYRKHFVQLGGLGIRDLCVHGDDILILAGPTMDLDGPVTVSRWVNGARTVGESLVFNENLEKLLDVPFSHASDHAEGMTLFSTTDGARPSLLIVYDTPGVDRKRPDGSVEADIFEL